MESGAETLCGIGGAQRQPMGIKLIQSVFNIVDQLPETDRPQSISGQYSFHFFSFGENI